jgi:carbamoyl-phosphate synthase large subunit
MNYNLLITSAGRRVSLVNEFRASLVKKISDGKVFAADLNPEWSSACRSSDGYFQVPSAEDALYVEKLISICIQNHIGLIIPTIDTELLILSENKEKFNNLGINVAISDLFFVKQCRDKRLSIELFNKFGIDMPKLVNKQNPTFPLFAKPFDGSLSKNIYLIKTIDDLTKTILDNEKLIFMEYISPLEFQEFTVDAYYDKQSNLKCLVPRMRIEVRGGEVSKAKTVKGTIYEVLKHKISYMPGAKSCITLQFFIHRITERIYGIEINPRFGGGYPLSYESGADYPQFLIQEYLLNEEIEFHEDWKENRVMLRYDSEVIFDA